MPIVHRSTRRLAHATCALAAAAALALPGSAAAVGQNRSEPAIALAQAAALFRFPGFATVLDSARLATPVVLHGELRDAAGDAVAGAPVLLSAWPSPEQHAALPDYADFALTPIARAVTDEAGRYVLRGTLTPALAQLLGPDGLDIELNVFDGSRHHVFMSQIAPVRETGAWVRGLLGASTAALTTGLGEGNRWNVDLARNGGQAYAPDLAGMPSLDLPARRVAYPGCSNYTKLPSKIVWEVVASGIVRNGALMETTYTKGAWTESGTGFSYDGGVTFAQNGSRARTATLTLGFHDYRAKRGETVHREFLADRFHHLASRHCAVNPRNDNVEQIATNPGAMLGGFTDQVAFDDFACTDSLRTRPANGSFVSTENARAKTYTSGFGFSPTGTGSFTGTTTSGYNDQTKVTFQFGDVRDGYWCGDTSYPAAPGQRVQGFRR
ncbi:MAG: hypothetical protein ACT4QG_05675 [Sporichthyaceae bacterium]